MSEERCNVAVWDDEGFWHYEAKDITAERAVELAHEIVTGFMAKAGLITKVMIENVSDETAAFLWERGKGIVFPDRGGRGRPQGEGLRQMLTSNEQAQLDRIEAMLRDIRLALDRMPYPPRPPEPTNQEKVK